MVFQILQLCHPLFACMLFHLPKPLHGWREFAGEVGVIVVGVLIALTAEEVLNEYNWHREVEKAEVALRRDAVNSSAQYAEQMTVGPCIIASSGAEYLQPQYGVPGTDRSQRRMLNSESLQDLHAGTIAE